MGFFSSLFSKKKDIDISRIATLDALKFLEVDIHNHLLPGIDDGAENTSQSLQLIEGLNELGLSTFICTPHIMHAVHDNNATTIKNAYNLLHNELKQSGNSSKIYYAAEHMVDDGIQQLIDDKSYMCMPNDYILIEMSYLMESAGIFHTVQELQAQGLKVIVAHPERYNYYHMNFKKYNQLKDAGCFFQLNLLSLSRYYGVDVKSTALTLMKSGMYDFVGTDIHHQRHLDAIRDVVSKYPVREMLKSCVIKNTSILDHVHTTVHA